MRTENTRREVFSHLRSPRSSQVRASGVVRLTTRILLPGRELVTYLVTCSRGRGRGKRCLWFDVANASET